MKVRCKAKCSIENENGEKITFEKGKIYKFKKYGPAHWPQILINGEWYDIVCYPSNRGTYVDDANVDLFKVIGGKINEEIL